MNRRGFLTLFGGLLAAPLAAKAVMPPIERLEAADRVFAINAKDLTEGLSRAGTVDYSISFAWDGNTIHIRTDQS